MKYPYLPETSVTVFSKVFCFLDQRFYFKSFKDNILLVYDVNNTHGENHKYLPIRINAINLCTNS